MKKLIFYIFMVLLLLPVLQKEWNFIQPMELNGSFVKVKEVDFSFDGWFSTKYQSSKENYMKKNIGFRARMIMAYNQIQYSCYDLANNPGGVVGKDNYLFLESYIFNETGENYIGDAKVDQIGERLLFLQAYFAKRNVDLLTVFLPSKASFYPEYFPSRYHYFPKSNYSAYCDLFDELNINYIDINQYFLDIKEEVEYPLFPKNGIHWTTYGMALGMDSVIKKIEHMRAIDLPDLSWEEPIHLEKMSHTTDFDAENLMNLIFEMPRADMPYPKLIFEQDSLKEKAKTLVISDSYYWRAYQSQIPHHVFDWGGFWYYFNTARHYENGKEVVAEVQDLEVEKRLLEQDVIVLFASQATLHLYPYGFDDEMFPILLPKEDSAFHGYLRKQIIEDSDEYDRLIQKANEEGRAFEKELEIQIDLNAQEFIFENDPKQKEIRKIIRRIKKDPKWLAKIEKKAKKRQISVDVMLQKDAEWIYKQKQKKEEQAKEK